MNIKSEINRAKLAAALLFLCSMFGFSALAQTNPVKVRYDAPRDPKLAPYADLLRSGQLLEKTMKAIINSLKFNL